MRVFVYLFKMSILITILLLFVGCGNVTSQSSIAPSQLLIELSDMPENWYVSSQGDLNDDDYRQQSGARIEFTVNNSQVVHIAAHQVYEYKNERQAAKEFERQLPIRFNSSSIASKTPWRTPEAWPYSSTVADQFYFACHEASINSVKTICVAFGQFDKYLVVFNTHLALEYMSYDDIQSILQEIDALMLINTSDNPKNEG
jgi:hypothetical protein